jgi:hypothetical protein
MDGHHGSLSCINQKIIKSNQINTFKFNYIHTSDGRLDGVGYFFEVWVVRGSV